MKKISTFHVCALAFAMAINFVGGQIALNLHLPIYLDSIGTFFIATVCGPIYGMIPSAISGVLMWILGDAYAIYYAPVGMLLGLITGLIVKRNKNIFISALWISVPTSFVSACITALLFGGITSSGSTVFVQILSKVIGLTAACFVVQLITDYCDRIIGLGIVKLVIQRMPKSLLEKLKTTD